MKRLTGDQREQVKSALAESDVEFWCRRLLIAQGRRKIEATLGFIIPMYSFDKLRKSECQWWKFARRRRRSLAKSLNESQWEELHRAVRSIADALKGRSLSEAVAMVSTRYPCNKELLSGLQKELQFWEA